MNTCTCFHTHQFHNTARKKWRRDMVNQLTATIIIGIHPPLSYKHHSHKQRRVMRFQHWIGTDCHISR